MKFSLREQIGYTYFVLEDGSHYYDAWHSYKSEKSAYLKTKSPIKLSFVTEFNTDIQLGKGWKLCLGGFYGKIQMKTPLIAYEEKYTSVSGHYSGSSFITDSVKIYTVGTDYFYDKVTIPNQGFYFGIGESVQLKRVRIDYDFAISYNAKLKTHISRQYTETYQSSIPRRTEIDIELHNNSNRTFGTRLSLSVQYKLRKHLALDFGVKYAGLIGMYTNDYDHYNSEQISLAFNGIRSFYTSLGLTLALR